MPTTKKPNENTPQIIHYISNFSYLHEIGDYPKESDAIDFIYSQAKHGLDQLIPPLVTSEKLNIEDFGDSTNDLLDSVYAADKEVIKLVLAEMANIIARLTHSFPDEESLAVFKADFIESLIFESIHFAEINSHLFPQLCNDRDSN